jgi:uncharacterized membrane protein YedE/YeeE
MTFPIHSLAAEHRPLGLFVAVVLGFAFGFVLERVGFGRAQKLVAQFHGTDMTVLKVIFSGIVTAMVGSVVLSGLGVLDLDAVAARYPTFLGPAAAGGFLLGAGFVISGYCPGTSWVAAASGKLDGLVTTLGVAVGAVGYSELLDAVPALARFHVSSDAGGLYLWQVLHLPRWVVAVLVVGLAIGAFAAASRIERAMAKRGLPEAEGPEITGSEARSAAP